MSVGYCIVFKELSSGRVSESQSYETLKEALEAASDLILQNCEPLRIRGPAGDEIGEAQLSDLIAATGSKRAEM